MWYKLRREADRENRDSLYLKDAYGEGHLTDLPVVLDESTDRGKDLVFFLLGKTP